MLCFKNLNTIKKRKSRKRPTKKISPQTIHTNISRKKTIKNERTKQNTITIIEYVRTQMKTFAEHPFNEIDSLIFAQLSYVNLDRVAPFLSEDKPWVPLSAMYKAEEFDALVKLTFNPDWNTPLIAALCASPRYRDVLMNYFVDKYDRETEEQFSAIAFQLPTGEVLVTYRGTDATMIGWKEDLNMMFQSPVPSQLSASAYLEEIATKTEGSLYIAGHSKGGNLAVYSAMHADNDILDRIISVYDLDGPGFPGDSIQMKNYKLVEAKIVKIIPEGSMVGIIFDSIGDVKIVKSTMHSIMQHFPFTWKISGEKFAYTDKLSLNARNLDKTLNTWVNELDFEQRKMLVETIHSIVEATKAEHMQDFAYYALRERDAILNLLKDMDEQTSDCLKEILRRFIKMSIKTPFSRSDIAKKEFEVFGLNE